MKYSKVVVASFTVVVILGFIVVSQVQHSRQKNKAISLPSSNIDTLPPTSATTSVENPTSAVVSDPKPTTTQSGTSSSTNTTTGSSPKPQADSTFIQAALDAILSDKAQDVTDKAQLEFVDTRQSLLATYVDFKPVAYHGIPVEDETIRVEIDNKTESAKVLYGSYFDIKDLPTEPTISASTIPNTLIGRVFTYSDFGGHQQSETATRADIKEPQKVVLVLKDKAGSKHAYLVWKTQVFDSMSWTVYTDATTGAELNVVQNFQT